ncbi:hypothetical protein CRG98_028159 [Punica granatum]|uniref:Uncharacterized protein n=1 Tax=Punica granatum TaxID=22663 RepID=A0A2I0J5E2_PUNGR|nr:hypothetical protein CRG98_028159 [Punica granatum]
MRGRGRQSATLTPPPRSWTFSVGTGDLGGGVGVVGWRPQPLNRPGTSSRSSRLTLRLGPPIGDPNPSTEVIDILRGYRQPRHQSTTPAPPQRSPVPTEVTGGLNGGVGVANGRPRPSFPFDLLVPRGATEAKKEQKFKISYP